MVDSPPKDAQRLVPYLAYADAPGAIDFLTRAFGFEEKFRFPMPDGRLGHAELTLGGEALDPLSLKLEMRRRLTEPDPDLHFLMVEEDEIDEQQFRVLDNEWLETSLGCIETLPIEKVRTNSKRYTRAWHAPLFGNIEVRIEHGKTGGDHLEMRITELTFDDIEIQPRPGCSAMQSAERTGTARDH